MANIAARVSRGSFGQASAMAWSSGECSAGAAPIVAISLAGLVLQAAAVLRAEGFGTEGWGFESLQMR